MKGRNIIESTSQQFVIFTYTYRDYMRVALIFLPSFFEIIN